MPFYPCDRLSCCDGSRTLEQTPVQRMEGMVCDYRNSNLHFHGIYEAAFCFGYLRCDTILYSGPFSILQKGELRMLKQRVMTGAGLTCGIVAVLLLSGHYWFLKAISVILSLMAAYELCRAGGYLKRKAFLFGTMAAAIFFALFGSPKLAGIVLLLSLAEAIYLMRQIQNMKTVPEWVILLTASVSAYFFGLLTEIRSQPHGFLLLTTVILIPPISIRSRALLRSGNADAVPIINTAHTTTASNL